MKQALNVVELGIVESDGGCPVGAARPVPDEQLVRDVLERGWSEGLHLTGQGELLQLTKRVSGIGPPR